MFKIDKGIKLPARSSAAYPFADMEKGDSFFVSMEYATRIRSAASVFSKRSKNKTLRFMTRTLTENDINGVRIWRTE